METAQRIRMLSDMWRIRKFEEKLRVLDNRGELPGFLHLCIGQEAVCVGTCSALEATDYITSTHRGHGHIIAKGADPKRMMAELFAKETGYNKGKGGSMHIADPNLGILGANGIVGGGFPLAAGAALSAKYLKNGRVAVCFFGDGASNEGTAHEAMNIAGAFDLPCIFLNENNTYGEHSYFGDISRTKNIADRAVGYGIEGITIDGNDIEAVYKTVTYAVNKAREGKGPTLIECRTWRWQPHCEGCGDYFRSAEVQAEWRAKDPIVRYRRYLIDLGVIDSAKADEIEAQAAAEIDAAVEYAKQSPEPDISMAMADIYAD